MCLTSPGDDPDRRRGSFFAPRVQDTNCSPETVHPPAVRASDIRSRYRRSVLPEPACGDPGEGGDEHGGGRCGWIESGRPLAVTTPGRRSPRPR